MFNLGKDAIDAGEPNITADFTFKLENQLGTNGRYEGYFLSPVLAPTAGQAGGSQLNINIYDQFARANDSSATLENAQINFISFNFNGETYRVETEELKAARDYQAVEAAVKAFVEATPALAGVNVALTNTFTTPQFNAQNQLTGAQVEGITLQLKTPVGELSNASVAGQAAPGAQGGVNFFTADAVESGIAGKVETNLELSNVGYGSQGGSVNIAGQSASKKGIEVFNVKAEKGVWLTQLASTPWNDQNIGDNAILAQSQLRVINLEGTGYFKLGTQQGGTENVNAAAAAGIYNVREFNAADYKDEIQINATIGDVRGELNLRDTQDNPAQDNVNYNYNLGSGNDKLFLNVDARSLEHEDFRLNINTGAGDDQVVLTTNLPNQGASLVNQQLNDNIVINAGSGNNFVNTLGAGNATIITGSGNDVIKTDNSGDKATFSFNAVNSNLSNSNNADSAGANKVAQSFDFQKATLQVDFKGFESTEILVASTNGKTSALQVNQAIKKAINDDAVLSKLLIAQDGPGNTLQIVSKIDGRMVADDLKVNLNAPLDFNATPTDAEKALMAQGRQMLTRAESEAAGFNYSNMTSQVNAADSLYSAVFAPAAGAATELTLDFAGLVTATDEGIYSNADNYLNVGGVKVQLDAGMTSAQIAQKVANTLNLQNSLNTGNLELRGQETAEGVFTAHNMTNAVVDGNKVVLTLSSSTRDGATYTPTGQVPTLVTLSRDFGAEDAYLSTTSTAGITVTAAQPFTIGGGTTSQQKSTFDFSNLKVGTAATTALTISSELPTTGATTANAALNISVNTLTAGDGPLAIANKVAKAINDAGHQAVVRGDRVEVTWAENGAPTATAPGKGNYGTVKIEATAPSAFVTGSSLSQPSSAGSYASSALVPASGTITQTINVGNLQVTEAGTLTIAGTTVNLTYGMNDRAIAKAIADADARFELSASNPTQVTVTLTQNETVNPAELVQPISTQITSGGNLKFAVVGQPNVERDWNLQNSSQIADGANSQAESDNVVNAGQGNDVIVLGTGQYSNDTIKLTGYNNGVNTIVNYDGRPNSAGRDYIDLSDYGITQGRDGRVVLGELNPATTMQNGTVARLQVSAEEFALLGSDILAQVNGTAGTNQIGNLGSLAATAITSGNSNYVVMVENAGNPGEYKVYHLTAAAAATNGQFSQAREIGTLDFGNQVELGNISVPDYSTDIVASLAGFNAFASTVSNGQGADLVVSINSLNNAGGLDLLTGNVSNFSSLTLEFTGAAAGQTLVATGGAWSNIQNLTVTGGTLDLTATTGVGPIVPPGGSVTLNSGLKVGVNALPAGVTVKSDTATNSTLTLVAANNQEIALSVPQATANAQPLKVTTELQTLVNQVANIVAADPTADAATAATAAKAAKAAIAQIATNPAKAALELVAVPGVNATVVSSAVSAQLPEDAPTVVITNNSFDASGLKGTGATVDLSAREELGNYTLTLAKFDTENGNKSDLEGARKSDFTVKLPALAEITGELKIVNMTISNDGVATTRNDVVEFANTKAQLLAAIENITVTDGTGAYSTLTINLVESTGSIVLENVIKSEQKVGTHSWTDLAGDVTNISEAGVISNTNVDDVQLDGKAFITGLVNSLEASGTFDFA